MALFAYWNTLCKVEDNWIPSTLGQDLTAMASISITRLKSNGDRGQLCRTPQLIMIGLE